MCCGVPPLYSGDIGSGDGVFCGKIQLCWIRRATITPRRMVVREKDGLSAAEWRESFSCSSTKSATIPGAGVSDRVGEPLWKSPMANRELIVTDSYGKRTHVISITASAGRLPDSRRMEGRTGLVLAVATTLLTSRFRQSILVPA